MLQRIDVLINKTKCLFHQFCQLGTDNPVLSEGEKRNIYIVNLVGGITVLLNFAPGILLFFLTRHYLIFIPSTLEGLLFMGVPLLNRARKYNSAVLLMFSAHAASAIYFGLLFGPAVNVVGISLFLVGSVYLLFQTKFYRRFCVLVSLLIVVLLEIDYNYELFPPLLLDHYNSKVVEKLATYIVLFLDGLVLYFYISALLKQNISQEKLVKERTLQLKKAADSMEDFVRKISHDMRISLNNLALTNQEIEERLEDQNNPDTLDVPVSFLQLINQGTKDLINLVNNVLDFSRIKEGKMKPSSLKILVIRKWAEERIKYHQQNANAKGVKILLQVDDLIPPRFVTDYPKMNRILDNILSNAIKFTNPDTNIQVSIGLNENHSAYLFSVTDQGPGIVLEEQENIFRLFTTSENGFADGSGIGLPTAKDLAASLNAQITVFSQPALGATFTITHPILTMKKVKDEEVSAKAIRENFQGACVLVIDDEKMTQPLYKMALDRLGCTSNFALSGSEGLDLAAKMPMLDVILLDKNLPDMAGFSMIQELKKNKKTKNIPIIIVSGDGEVETQKLALLAGADGFLVKPISINVVQTELKKYLSCQITT
jgi:signal transduction histidine kinase/ActR/RegA family two-component response regulator